MTETDTSASESDIGLVNKRGAKVFLKQCKENTSETDSTNSGENFDSLPTKTSGWSMAHLESLGIAYDEDYKISPVDILNMVVEELDIFGPLTENQKKNMESLKQNIKFSSSFLNIMADIDSIEQNGDGDIFLPGLEEDIENLSNSTDMTMMTESKDFLINLQLMISWQAAFTNGLCETGVSEDMFADILKSFAKMCHVLPVPGSAQKCNMDIKGVTVDSVSDVILVPSKYRKYEFAKETACIVSIVKEEKMEKLKTHRKSRIKRLSKDSETDVCCEPPAIYSKVKERVLAQHGGDLLIHRNVYGSILSKGRIWKYLPGMICIGPEVIFTLLKIKGKHVRELSTMSKNETLKLDFKATIYYSKPMDLLKKEDRDILVESFLRLSNFDTNR